MLYRLNKPLKRTPLIKQIINYALKLVRPNYSYNQDGLATFYIFDFMNEELFIEDPKVHWKVHTLRWAAYQGKNMEGDFVECGVNRG
jgi:hypothetical protein